jgi:RNA polymerase sigma-70 factor (ECF subfamily)
MSPKFTLVKNDDARETSETDRARLERMFVEHHSVVWRVLRRRGLSPESAADATQETFIVASSRLRDVPRDSERAFLIGTALRMAHTLERKTVRFHLDGTMDQHAQRLTDSSGALADIEMCDMALSRVKPEHAEVLVLHEIEGLSSPEIAALLEIPLGSVASRLRRGREQFHTALVRIQRTMDRENGREKV